MSGEQEEQMNGNDGLIVVWFRQVQVVFVKESYSFNGELKIFRLPSNQTIEKVQLGKGS